MGRKRTVNARITTPHLYARRDGFYYRFPDRSEKKIAGAGQHALALIEWARLEGVRLSTDAVVFSAVAAEFEKSHFPTIANRTQTDYARSLRMLCSVFGQSALDTVRPVDVARYREMRTEALLQKKNGDGTQANRDLAVLSVMWRWATEHGYTEKPNPVASVRRNKEKGRDVYMPDAVFSAIYLAGDQTVKDAMDVAIATGMDCNVILKATVRECIIGDFEELMLRRSKTHVPVRYRLRGQDGGLNAFGKKIKEMVTRQRNATGQYLIQDANGQGVPYYTFADRFDRARTASGYAPGQYQFKDIRPKVASDASDDTTASQLLGHKSINTTKKHYIRRGRLVEPAK